MLQSILLGVVQGATEFLPISSSGHLALIQQFMKIDNHASFDVFLHLGTLLATLTYFRKKILNLSGVYLKSIIIGTIPAIILGIFFQSLIFSFFDSTYAVLLGLVITSLFLLSTKKLQASNQPINPNSSLYIGLAQACALIPGISRSGATISTALHRGISQEEAFAFSFILSIPAVAGATFLSLSEINFQTINLPHYLSGVISAALIGYLSLSVLEKIIKRSNFYRFGYYTTSLSFFILAIL